MSNVGQPERATQNRIVALLRDTLGYTYLGNWQDRADNRNIETARLRQYLTGQGYTADLITRAVAELERTAGDQGKGPYQVNEATYSLLRYGVNVAPDIGAQYETVMLIDWKFPERNDFAFAEEVTVHGTNTKRPDIVLYVNGIALGVLELKRSIVTVSEGIRQNLDNQRPEFIERFFTTMQLVMAGNDTEGLRYGTIQTPEKYYLTWKESGSDNPLDRTLVNLVNKTRFLELIHDFISFDAGTKKLCRHNQYFGAKAAQERIVKHEGGIIWHHQGSGKSLLMVWLARWIRENIPNSRVLIVTDRIELDDQIEGIFTGVGEQIVSVAGGRDLLNKLNDAGPSLMCSLIHKFGHHSETELETLLGNLFGHLPTGFSPKGDIYVFVDECHRTQSGIMHQAMKQILPQAMVIGFTGTPLLKEDKAMSIATFGPYIHTYKFNEAVRDEVVLDLRYEARDIDQALSTPETIDEWFEIKTRGLTAVARAQLKQRWATMQKVLSSRSRLEKIVADITLDMDKLPRLINGHGNALLVTSSIHEACKVYEIFVSNGFTQCAIITSYRPTLASTLGETAGNGYSEKMQQYTIYNRMLNGQTQEEFERIAKETFVKQPGQMKLLIVVDKLLTGFDAPSATYIYIDKQMRDHGLFQAICRVNRKDGDDKEYGYIIDYKDLFQSLRTSVQDYTSNALDGYDDEDINGLIKNRVDEGREDLNEAREKVKILCEPVPPPYHSLDYIHFFFDESADLTVIDDLARKRMKLYRLVGVYLRAYANLANDMAEAGYSADETAKIIEEVKHYENVVREIQIASGDLIDLKMYNQSMRQLIDTYIEAKPSKRLSSFEDMSLIQFIADRGESALEDLPDGIKNNKEATAETIENNMRRVITEEQPRNPAYYDKMSELLNKLIEERRKRAIEYQEYLNQIIELARNVQDAGTSGKYPASLKSNAQRALYDNLNRDEALALAIDRAILATRKDNWRANIIKEREVQGVVRQHIHDEELFTIIMEIVRNQSEY